MRLQKLGRPPDSIKELCRAYVLNDKLIERLCKIAVSAPRHNDQIKAIELLLDRGFGKAEQAIDLTTHESDRPTTDALIETLTALRNELDGLRKGNQLETAK